MQHPYPYAALLAMCALGFSGAARSVVDGEIKAVNGTYEYLININNHDITSNRSVLSLSTNLIWQGCFRAARTVRSR